VVVGGLGWGNGRSASLTVLIIGFVAYLAITRIDVARRPDSGPLRLSWARASAEERNRVDGVVESLTDALAGPACELLGLVEHQ